MAPLMDGMMAKNCKWLYSKLWIIYVSITIILCVCTFHFPTIAFIVYSFDMQWEKRDSYPDILLLRSHKSWPHESTFRKNVLNLVLECLKVSFTTLLTLDIVLILDTRPSTSTLWCQKCSPQALELQLKKNMYIYRMHLLHYCFYCCFNSIISE